MIGIILTNAQVHLCPLHDADSCRRSEQSTDIDGHIENWETGVALVGILRIIIEVAHHNLQVTLEQACSETDAHQCHQHYSQCHSVTSQGNRQQQIAQEHDNDTCGYHLTESKLVGHKASNKREEIDKHQEWTVDDTSSTRCQSIIGSQEQCKDG